MSSVGGLISDEGYPWNPAILLLYVFMTTAAAVARRQDNLDSGAAVLSPPAHPSVVVDIP